VEALAARLAQEQRLGLLVNNAGFGLGAPFAEADPAALEAMLAVHVTAVVRLTRAALPVLAARGAGAIVNVASAAAFAVRPTFYDATKAFVVEFTKGLHPVAAARGVRLQALCPAWTRTEFFAARGRPFPAPAAATMSPETLVAASLTGLARGELVCVPALDDPTLLDEIDARRREIVARAGATGIPARRYGDALPARPERVCG
jgi:short-subunit dehydrogenase